MTESQNPSENLPQSTAPDSSYGEGAIQILEGLEAVRKRPGMFVRDLFITNK